MLRFVDDYERGVWMIWMICTGFLIRKVFKIVISKGCKRRLQKKEATEDSLLLMMHFVCISFSDQHSS
jgi:hypothetical protein